MECWRGTTRSRPPPTALTEEGLYEPGKSWSGEVRYGETSSPGGDDIDDSGVLWCAVVSPSTVKLTKSRSRTTSRRRTIQSPGNWYWMRDQSWVNQGNRSRRYWGSDLYRAKQPIGQRNRRLVWGD